MLVDGYLRPGDVIEIRFGDRRFGGPGTRVQTFVEDEFEVQLFVDLLGTSRMAHAGVHQLAVVPGEPRTCLWCTARGWSEATRRRWICAYIWQDRWGNACR